MKKTKKIVALFLAAVMLVCTTVAATVAFLQSQTDVVTNTMTVGKVVITLDEAPVDADGQATSSSRVTSNSYKLYPSKEYDKDPTVHIDSESEDCFVFVKVVNGLKKGNDNIEAASGTTMDDGTTYKTIAEQIAANGWLPLNGADDVYYYGGTNATQKNDDGSVSAGKNLLVFNEFKIDPSVDNTLIAKFQNATVKIEAYAVQSEGFADAAAAWAAAPATWKA